MKETRARVPRAHRMREEGTGPVAATPTNTEVLGRSRGTPACPRRRQRDASFFSGGTGHESKRVVFWNVPEAWGVTWHRVLPGCGHCRGGKVDPPRLGTPGTPATDPPRGRRNLETPEERAREAAAGRTGWGTAWPPRHHRPQAPRQSRRHSAQPQSRAGVMGTATSRRTTPDSSEDPGRCRP